MGMFVLLLAGLVAKVNVSITKLCFSNPKHTAGPLAQNEM